MAFATSNKSHFIIMQPYTISSSTCNFSNPINLGSSTENYAFSTQTCNTDYYLNASSTGVPVHFDIGTSATSSISGSSSFSVIPTFSGDGIIIITLMIIFLFISLSGSVIKAIDRIKTKKSYIRYTNADVEISEDL